MGTEVKATIDGQWVDIPQGEWHAIAAGWYKGVDYNFSWFSEDSKYQLIYEWCKDTWGINSFTWKTFEGNVYFYREEDALLCRLKWAS